MMPATSGPFKPLRARVFSSLLSAVVILCLCSPSHSKFSSKTASSQLQAKYMRLENLCFSILRRGSTPRVSREIRAINEFFKASGHQGASFLLDRLREVNAEERVFLQGKQDGRAIQNFWSELRKRKRAPDCKLYLAHILAEIHASAAQELQNEILAVLEESYTPSTYVFGSPSVLNWALLRTGSQSVPHFLKLADSISERLRCVHSTNLDDIAGMMSGQGSEGNWVPPLLEPVCRVTQEDSRKRALAAWEQWWREVGSKQRFPTFPSFFDED